MDTFLVVLYLLANGMQGALPTIEFEGLDQCEAGIAYLHEHDPNDSPGLFGGVPVVHWEATCLQLAPPS